MKPPFVLEASARRWSVQAVVCGAEKGEEEEEGDRIVSCLDARDLDFFFSFGRSRVNSGKRGFFPTCLQRSLGLPRITRLAGELVTHAEQRKEKREVLDCCGLGRKGMKDREKEREREGWNLECCCYA